jgi:hypothetical protein
MNTDKEWLSIEPKICERGRSMSKLRKGLLTALGLIWALAPMAAVFAATEVTDIRFADTSEGGVQIVLATTGDTPEVSVFATEDPPRIDWAIWSTRPSRMLTRATRMASS